MTLCLSRFLEFGEDDQELLRIVLNNLEVAETHAQLGMERVTNMERLGVVAIAPQPAHHSLPQQSIPTSPDVSRS